MKRAKKAPTDKPAAEPEDKRPRTAFSGSQLARLKVIKKLFSFFFFYDFITIVFCFC